MGRFYWVLLGLGLLGRPVWGQAGGVAVSAAKAAPVEGYFQLNELCWLPQGIHLITMLHSDSALDSLPDGTRIEANTVVAHTQPLPAIRSAYYGSDLATSEAAYAAHDFGRAAALLREAVRHEPDNAFLLDAYARALYQVADTKPASYTAYQQLFQLQKAAHPTVPGELAVDMWFLESYWKFGTLCLDNGQWPAAVRSIERFLAGYTRLPNSDPALLEQALGYLTEAFFQLHSPRLCRYYGQRTLRLYPRNQYVRPYLAALPGTARKPHR